MESVWQRVAQLSWTLLSILIDRSSVIWLVNLNSSSVIHVSFLGSSILFRGLQLWSVSLSPSCSIAFSAVCYGVLLLFAFFYFHYVICWKNNPLVDYHNYSLDSERQQVSSDIQDSSKYPRWFLYCCGLDGFNNSSYLQSTPSFFQVMGNYSKSSEYDWYHWHFHVPTAFFLCILTRSRY